MRSMTDPTTIRRRLEHVQSLLETTEDHIDCLPDNDALLRAIGMLEQTFVELDELESKQKTPDDTETTNGKAAPREA